MSDVSKIYGLNLQGGIKKMPPRDKIREIRMIFGGPHIASNSRHNQDRYVREGILTQLLR